MRAVVVEAPGAPEALRLTERPEPEPGPGELTITVAYAGVGFVDTLFRSGALPLPVPFIPGIEATGHVRAVGPGVTGFTAGQPVAALLNDFGRGVRVGGYAEVAVAHQSMAAPLASDDDLARVAAEIVNGVTAWVALHDLARLDSRDDVLVLGASGGLGGTTARLAALHPARRIIGVVGSAAKRASAPAECTHVVLAGELDDAVAEITGGRGVDVVVDPVGGAQREAAFGRLAPFGRHLILGNASAADPGLSGDAIWHGTRQVSGLSLGAVAHLVPDRVSAAAAAVADLVQRGFLHGPDPAVRPLEEAADVHRALEDRTAPPKTVLAVGA
jgi:NADPH2:quinone reductase